MSDWNLIKTSDLREIEYLVAEIRSSNNLEMISQKAAKIKALCSCGYDCNVKPGGAE